MTLLIPGSCWGGILRLHDDTGGHVALKGRRPDAHTARPDEAEYVDSESGALVLRRIFRAVPPEFLVRLPDVESDAWKTLAAAPWRWTRHINVLEGVAELLLIRCLIRQPRMWGRTFVLLQDSAVVVAAGSRGRSSSIGLNRYLRRVAAMAFACQMHVVRRWIRSAANPADKPSRLW